MTVALSAREEELHEHYASNAQARGHREDCATITEPRNWPKITGRPTCTCGQDR